MKKKLFSLIAILSTVVGVNAQTARVMAIHNSADPLVDTVDVWLVTSIGTEKLVDNLGFRQATGFVNAPAGVDFRLAFASKNSTVISDTIISFQFNLAANSTHVLLAQGNVGSGFNPQRNFKLHVISPAFERSTTGGNSTLAVLVHGSTDAPNVDVALRKGNEELGLIENLAYDDNTDYITLDEDDYYVDVMPAGLPAGSLLTYAAPLKTLNVGDSALVLFASGYLNPSNNNNGPSFGVYAALSNGNVIPLPLVSNFRLQAFHNCADPIADSVDVWLINRTTNTNTRLISDFAFRKATPFIDAPANQNIAIGLTLPGAPIADTVYVESIGGIPGGFTVMAVASGVLDTGMFEPNPSNVPLNFELVGVNALEKSTESGKVALQVFHGASDAPAVDINARGVGTLFPDLTFKRAGEDYLFVAPQQYTIDIAAAGTQNTVASYTAPLSAYADSALIVFASGFLSPNSPVGKDIGSGFALIAVTPSGSTIELPSVATGLTNKYKLPEGITIYPNPANDNLRINVKDQTKTDFILTISDLSGRAVLTEELNTVLISNNAQLDISKLNKGMYFISLSNKEGTSTQKLIIQ